MPSSFIIHPPLWPLSLSSSSLCSPSDRAKSRIFLVKSRDPPSRTWTSGPNSSRSWCQWLMRTVLVTHPYSTSKYQHTSLLNIYIMPKVIILSYTPSTYTLIPKLSSCLILHQHIHYAQVIMWHQCCVVTTLLQHTGLLMELELEYNEN